MKRLLSLLLVTGALLIASNVSSQVLIIVNNQPCAYTVYVFEATIPTCALTASYVPVVVPPGAVVNYAAAAGSWVVGTCVEELWPVPAVPPIANCTGLSNPFLGMSCGGYPPTAPMGGTCAPVPVLVQGAVSVLTI